MNQKIQEQNMNQLVKSCLDEFAISFKNQKRIERKNKILAQSNKVKGLQISKNSNKIIEEKTQIKPKKKLIKKEKQVIQPKKKTAIEELLQQTHLAILKHGVIEDQMVQFIKFRNKITENYGNENDLQIQTKKLQDSSIGKSIQSNGSSQRTKQTVNLAEKENFIGKANDTFALNKKFKKLNLRKSTLSEIEQIDGIKTCRFA